MTYEARAMDKHIQGSACLRRTSARLSSRMTLRLGAASAALWLAACASATSNEQLAQPGTVMDANAAVHCPRGTAFAAGQTQGRLSAVWCERPDGRRHGPYIEWWENHQKKGAGLYEDGTRQGVWTFFLSNGQRDSQIEYRNGVVVSPAGGTPAQQ
jgi:hypothetical protein